MTEKAKSSEEIKKNTEENKNERNYTIKLLLTVFLAFITALLYRRSMGIWAMTPLAFIFCAAAAFIALDPKVKNVIFGLTVFAVNTIEQKDLTVTIIFTALCLLARMVSDYAVSSYQKSKKKCIVISSVGSVICILLSFSLVGNPIAAISANGTFNDYIDAKYPPNEEAVLGKFEFSDIYYDFRTKAYSIDAVSNKYPTEFGAITLSGDIVRDGFENVMEEKICEPYVLEITSILREAFPNDNFGVEFDKVAHLPGDAILTKAEGELRGSIAFSVSIGGVQSATAMKAKVNEYIRALDKSGVDYYRITFKSGTDSWIRRTMTVDGDRFDIGAGNDIYYTPAGTSYDFNRYMAYLSE